MAKTVTKTPTRKVIATAGGGGLGDAFSEVFLYFLQLALAHDVPDHVALAMRILISAAFAVTIGYIVPPASDEGVA